jgi:phage regulator Rha-like protein
MSSREIAELCEKRHDNVKRTIDALVERGVIELPQTEEIPTATKPSTVYHLGKRDVGRHRDALAGVHGARGGPLAAA